MVQISIHVLNLNFQLNRSWQLTYFNGYVLVVTNFLMLMERTEEQSIGQEVQ